MTAGVCSGHRVGRREQHRSSAVRVARVNCPHTCDTAAAAPLTLAEAPPAATRTTRRQAVAAVDWGCVHHRISRVATRMGTRPLEATPAAVGTRRPEEDTAAVQPVEPRAVWPPAREEQSPPTSTDLRAMPPAAEQACARTLACVFPPLLLFSSRIPFCRCTCTTVPRSPYVYHHPFSTDALTPRRSYSSRHPCAILLLEARRGEARRPCQTNHMDSFLPRYLPLQSTPSLYSSLVS